MPDDVRHPVIDKSRLPSRHVTVGPERAPHRAFLYSMGLSEEQINQPLIGVATTWNEAAPCNIALSRQAQAAKKGVAAAGGTPREFTTITVTDGIAMGHEGMKSSLVSREVIADSVELTMRGHCYDAMVGLAGCDKSLPGLMMAMVRLNVPSVFMYGGSILPGRFKGKDVTIGDVFEGVGAHNVGNLTDEELHELECGGRRLDQWRAAHPGDRERGRHRVRPARFRRDREAHALHRRSEAGRPLCHEGSARYRRRPGLDEGALGGRLSAWRLLDGDRQDDRRKSGECEIPERTGCCPHDLEAARADRWLGRAEGQSGARRRDREGRRHEDRALRGHRAVLRLRGGRVRGGR